MSITCPLNCNITPLPVEANYCNPDTTNAQIPVIYIAALQASAFTDITDPAEWAGRLDQTSMAADVIRTLHVIGAKPVATPTTLDLGADHMVTIQKEHKLDLIVRETGLVNQEFLRSTECGGNYKITYVIGKYMFVNADSAGNLDNDMIEVNIVINDQATNVFTDAYEFVITITWKSKFHPVGILNPLA